MINLMPDDMWLPAMPQDLNEDDIDVYGRLIIDIPGKKPTLETETITANSTHKVAAPPESPLRINGDIPIKLLLKRRFQNCKTKPQKLYRTEDEKEHINETNVGKLVEECKSNRLSEHETTETNTIDDDYDLIVSNPTDNKAIIVSPKNYHSLNNSQVFKSRQESLSPAAYKKIIHHADEKVNQRVPQQNGIELTTFDGAVEKQKTLDQFKENLQSTEKQNTTRIVVNNIVQKTSYPNRVKKTTPHGTPEKQNNLNVSEVSKKEDLSSSHNSLQQLKNQWRPHIDTIDLTVTPSDHNMKLTTSSVIPEKQIALEQSNTNNSDSKCLYIHNLSQVEQETTVITHSKQCNRDNNEKNTLDAQISSGKFRRTPQQKRKQRISVVSNEFLYQGFSKRETLTRPKNHNQTQKSIERKCPQKYQEALIDFMERHYQLAIRENIPLKVNSKPLYPDPNKENPDTFLTEVIHVDSRQQHFSNFSYQSTKQPRISMERTTHSASEPGYNILVHRGPDINRIVITIASTSEGINQTTNCQTSNEDQRVPENTINNIHCQPSQSSYKKRSYFYKEPSLRTFRKHLCNRKDNHARNRVQISRFDSPSNDNAAYGQHFSTWSNVRRNHDLPPAIENSCYTYQHLGQNYSPVTNASCAWELYKAKPVQLDEISKLTKEIPCNLPEFYLDSCENHILFRPLNLSLKAHERPHPEFSPRYPAQAYY